MITFNYTGNPYPSIQTQQEDKRHFLDKLGPFKEEFDAKDGFVTFNYSYSDTDERRIAFVLGKEQASLGDFIMRWNDYMRDFYGNTN